MVGIASDTASAEQVAYLSDWSIDFATDREEVTAFGDTNKTYVSGLPDASGDFSGFFDNATQQTYTAAVDGLPRKFYIYPTTAVTGTYFFGTGYFDFSASAGVGGAVEISGSWNAAGPVRRVG